MENHDHFSQFTNFRKLTNMFEIEFSNGAPEYYEYRILSYNIGRSHMYVTAPPTCILRPTQH